MAGFIMLAIWVVLVVVVICFFVGASGEWGGEK